MRNNQNTTNVCQCLKCHVTFDFSEREKKYLQPYGACPVCGGAYTIIQFGNGNDEDYVDKLAETFSK